MLAGQAYFLARTKIRSIAVDTRADHAQVITRANAVANFNSDRDYVFDAEDPFGIAAPTTPTAVVMGQALQPERESLRNTTKKEKIYYGSVWRR